VHAPSWLQYGPNVSHLPHDRAREASGCADSISPEYLDRAEAPPEGATSCLRPEPRSTGPEGPPGQRRNGHRDGPGVVQRCDPCRHPHFGIFSSMRPGPLPVRRPFGRLRSASIRKYEPGMFLSPNSCSGPIGADGSPSGTPRPSRSSSKPSVCAPTYERRRALRNRTAAIRITDALMDPSVS